MISSQDGTEERRPRAAFRPARPGCSPGGLGRSPLDPRTPGLPRTRPASRRARGQLRSRRAPLPRPRLRGACAAGRGTGDGRWLRSAAGGGRSRCGIRLPPAPAGRGGRLGFGDALARGRRTLMPGPPAVSVRRGAARAGGREADRVWPGAVVLGRRVTRCHGAGRRVAGRTAEPGRQPGDGRLARRRGRRQGRLGARQRHPSRVVVGGQHMPATRVEDPLGGVHATAGDEREFHLPAAVAALLRIPLRVFRVRAERFQPIGHDLAQSRPGRRVSVAADRGGLGLVRDIGAFSQDRSLEPAHAFDRDARRVRDLLHRFTGADSCLDLLGSQRALHFDLVLREPGGLAQGDRPEPLVYRQHEAWLRPGTASTA